MQGPQSSGNGAARQVYQTRAYDTRTSPALAAPPGPGYRTSSNAGRFAVCVDDVGLARRCSRRYSHDCSRHCSSRRDARRSSCHSGPSSFAEELSVEQSLFVLTIGCIEEAARVGHTQFRERPQFATIRHRRQRRWRRRCRRGGLPCGACARGSRGCTLAHCLCLYLCCIAVAPAATDNNEGCGRRCRVPKCHSGPSSFAEELFVEQSPFVLTIGCIE